MIGTAQGARTARWALIVALAFLGVSAVAGGYGLASDPSGAKLRIPLEWLRGSPFPDYLVPGLVLLVVLGVAPLVVVYALWTGRSWSPAAAVLIGVALIVWLGVEIAVIGYKADPPFQLVYGVLGAVIVALAGPRAMRRAR